MKRQKTLFIGVITAALLVPILAVDAKPPTAASIRPVEDFVERQGTFCISALGESYETQIVDGNFVGNCSTGAPPILFVPPTANFIGTGDAEQNRVASIDYAGLADYWSGGQFGTNFSGSVMERPLADGRAHVKVILRTENALTWVVEGDDYTADALLFGNRAPDVVAGAEPALGSSSLELDFINTAPGADLPDLLQLAALPEPGQQLLSLKIGNKAKGPLTELFGVPAGTPGLNIGTQVGLLGNPNCGVEPSALADCFPVEQINLRVIGK